MLTTIFDDEKMFKALGFRKLDFIVGLHELHTNTNSWTPRSTEIKDWEVLVSEGFASRLSSDEHIYAVTAQGIRHLELKYNKKIFIEVPDED